mgnify:CR=1 FL=1
MKISELVSEGLKCPNCGGVKMRAGYHEWQNMDSFICRDCGLHWQEDFKELSETWRFKQERRFIWVMCDTRYPKYSILNPDSIDDEDDRIRFVRKGLKRLKMKVL